METSVENQEHEIGMGEWQSKLADKLNKGEKAIQAAFLYQKKMRGIHQTELIFGIKTAQAFRDAILTFIKCLNTHEDREDFAKRMYEHYK